MHDTKGTWLSSIITATANFSTQYNFQCISVALVVMSYSQCTSTEKNCKNGTQAEWVNSVSSAAVFLGAICGQLTMGFLGDYFSRNFALCWTLVIAGFSSILSATASVGSAESVYSIIIVFRFLLGVGLGGVYPLAAAKASEDYSTEDKDHHHKKINPLAAAWSFFWQMPGLFVPWLLGYILSESTDLSTENRWKLILGLGCVPSFIAVGLLLFEASLEGADLFVAQKNSNSGKVTLSHILKLLEEHDNVRKLLVTGGGWFIFDMIMYGVTLLTGVIIKEISGQQDDDVSSQSSVQNVSSKQMIASSAAIVVTSVSILLIPYFGLKRAQVYSFINLAFFCVLLASLFEYLHHYNPEALFALYVLTYSSLNFGLGATTYTFSSAVFPQEIRGTFNGVSAACGKVGAFVGAFTFIYIAKSPVGYSGLLGICSFLALFAAAITTICIHKSDFEDVDTDLALTANEANLDVKDVEINNS